MSTVTIRGSIPHLELLVDGQKVMRLKSFALHGDHADKPLRLILEIAPGQVEIETEAEVTTV